jgi:hypothetical protein
MKDDGPVTFAAGKPFVEEVTAGKLNRVAEQGTETARFIARSGLASDDAPLVEHWIGKVVLKGPSNEANLTEQKYWVERQSPKTNIAFDAALEVEQDKTPPSLGATKTIVRATRLTNAATGESGTVVEARLPENTIVHVFAEAWVALPTPQTFYYFIHVPMGAAFRVALEQTSGTRGIGTTQASWVYTVKDRFTGTTLGTGISPLVRRWPFAADDAVWGWADYDENGDIVLVEAIEPQDQGAC